VQVEASFPADGQAFELVEQGEGLLHDVAELAQALDVRAALAGDDRQDPALAQLPAVGVAVVALVAQQSIGACARTPHAAGHWRNAVDQGQRLSDVVDVGRSGDDCEGGAVPVADQMVFATGLAPVDRRRASRLAPFFAFTWEASMQARDQSIWPTAFNSASSIRCSVSKTPASCQRPSRRQQVCPEPKPSSRGSCCHVIPVYSANKMPCRHRRSSTGRGPGDRSGHLGSNGSITAHKASSTIHGLLLTPSRTAESSHRTRLPATNHEIVLRALRAPEN